MNISRSVAKLFGSNVLTQALSIVAIAFFAQELGAAKLGVFFLFQALLGVLSIPTDFGIREAVEKRISEGDNPSDVLASALVLKLVPFLLVISIILLLQPYINRYVGADVAMLIIIGLVLQDGFRLTLHLLKGELRVEETATIKVVNRLVFIGTAFALVLSGYGVQGLIYGLIIGHGISFVFGWKRASTPIGRPSIEQARSLFDYAKFKFVSIIGGYTYQWADVLVIGFFLTQTHVGAYEIAWRITAVVMHLSQAIGNVVFPQISAWSSAEKFDQIENLLPEAITSSLILVIPSFFGVLVVSEALLGLVFGPEFIQASLVLIILMSEKILQAAHRILGRTLTALDHPGLAARAGVISTVLNLLLNVSLIPLFGIVGAAIATVVSFSVNTLLHANYLRRSLTIRIPHRSLGWSCVSAIVMAVVLLLVKQTVGINSIALLTTYIIGGALIYFVVLFFDTTLRRKTIRSLTELFSVET